MAGLHTTRGQRGVRTKLLSFEWLHGFFLSLLVSEGGQENVDFEHYLGHCVSLQRLLSFLVGWDCPDLCSGRLSQQGSISAPKRMPTSHPTTGFLPAGQKPTSSLTPHILKGLILPPSLLLPDLQQNNVPRESHRKIVIPLFTSLLISFSVNPKPNLPSSLQPQLDNIPYKIR